MTSGRTKKTAASPPRVLPRVLALASLAGVLACGLAAAWPLGVSAQGTDSGSLELVDPDTPFTSACPTALSIPVKHMTGRYYAPDPVHVVLRYATGENPNGSQDDIAGVCSDEGNVFGLMPHPEHAVDALTSSTDGLKIFESMRDHAERRGGLLRGASSPASS